MVAFNYPRLADKSRTVLPAPQIGYATGRASELSVQFAIDIWLSDKSIRFGFSPFEKDVHGAAAAPSGRIFQLDNFFRMLIAMPWQMSFHPALTGNNGFCVRKI